MNLRTPLLHPLLAPVEVALLAAVAVGIGLFAAPGTVVDWMSEEGWVERGTLFLYFLAGLAICGDRERLRAPVWPALSALMALAACRELDLHKSLTGTSIMKVSYYLGAAPGHHKLAALAVMATAALSAGYLVVRFAGSFRRALAKGHPVAVTVLVFLVTLVTSKVMDRLTTVLAEDWGIPTSAAARALQLAVEELLELDLPALVLLGVVQFRQMGGQVPGAVSSEAGDSSLWPAPAGSESASERHR